MNRILAILALLIVPGPLLLANDPTPLRSLIDEQLGTAGLEVCSDADFIRRSSLDLTGRTPTAQEVREFLADSSTDKRIRLVDRLLASPLHVRHLATFIDVTLMERRASKHVSQDEWMAWLYQSVRQNKPWNKLAEEVLSADGDTPEHRAAARFYLDRDAEPNLITRDVSRIFFGRDIQCAQCHDHPIVSDYLQSDYQGLLALISPGYAVEVKKGDAKVTVYGEKAGVDSQFESVFKKGIPHRSGPRVPGGVLISEPYFPPGEEYKVAIADGVKAVPHFSRRAQLAQQATNGQNRLFNENIVNRLWAMMLGRGLFQPVDMNHPENPAAHPELVALLADQFVAMNFDMRAFIKEIALTTAYQRPFDPPSDFQQEIEFAQSQLQKLEARRGELQEVSKVAGREYESADQAWHEAEKAMLPVVTEFDTVRTGLATAQTKLKEVQSILAKTTEQLAAKQMVHPSVKAAAEAAAQAVTQLPGDQELAAAAQKFTERHQQLTTEIDQLQKVMAENNTKLPELTTNFDNAQKLVEEKKKPAEEVKAVWLEKEQQFHSARKAMVLESSRLASINEQLLTARKLISLNTARESLKQGDTAIATLQTARATTEKRIVELTSSMAQLSQELLVAQEPLTKANAELEQSRALLAAEQQKVDAILKALKSTEEAAAQLPDDAALAQATALLKERANAATASLQSPQQMVEKATAIAAAAQSAVNAVQERIRLARVELDTRQAEMKTADEQIAQTQAKLTETRESIPSQTDQVMERLTQSVRLAALKPLTPEQLCWSIFQTTGVYERTRAAEAAALEQSAPLTEEQKKDASQVLNREFEIEQKTYDKLKGNLASFVKYFGAGPGEPQGDFFATVDQALFASNGGDLHSWVAPVEGNATDRVLKAADAVQRAEELYLTVLSRLPTAEELELVGKYFEPRTADRDVAAREMVWALMTSAEFRFNH